MQILHRVSMSSLNRKLMRFSAINTSSLKTLKLLLSSVGALGPPTVQFQPLPRDLVFPGLSVSVAEGSPPWRAVDSKFPFLLIPVRPAEAPWRRRLKRESMKWVLISPRCLKILWLRCKTVLTSVFRAYREKGLLKAPMEAGLAAWRGQFKPVSKASLLGLLRSDWGRSKSINFSKYHL